MKRKQETMITV